MVTVRGQGMRVVGTAPGSAACRDLPPHLILPPLLPQKCTYKILITSRISNCWAQELLLQTVMLYQTNIYIKISQRISLFEQWQRMNEIIPGLSSNTFHIGMECSWHIDILKPERILEEFLMSRTFTYHMPKHLRWCQIFNRKCNTKWRQKQVRSHYPKICILGTAFPAILRKPESWLAFPQDYAVPRGLSSNIESCSIFVEAQIMAFKWRKPICHEIQNIRFDISS